VYPETKHPTYHRRIGLALEPRLLDLLRRHGLNHPGAPVLVQSFEVANLRELRRLGLRSAAVQLLKAAGAPYDTVARGGGPTYADLATPEGLRGVAAYADGIGPDKALVVPRTPDGALDRPTALVGDAHAAGLLVHPYTFRAENAFLPVDHRTGTDPRDVGRAVEEQVAHLAAGVDGLFTDHPDLAVRARAEFRSRSGARVA
jgi:glycerophosphoryl diester phosphodiesterase